MGFGQGGEKGLTSPLERLLMELTIRAPQVPSPLPNEVKTKGHIVIPYTQGLCERIKICGRYGIQTNSKVAISSGTHWSPPKSKMLWSAKVGPYTGSNVVTFPVMMNI